MLSSVLACSLLMFRCEYILGEDTHVDSLASRVLFPTGSAESAA